MTDPDPTESRPRLCEVVALEVQRQTTEREEEQAFTDLSDLKHDPANPGASFAKKIVQRLEQARLEQQ